MDGKMMGSGYGVIQDDGGGLITMGNRYETKGVREGAELRGAQGAAVLVVERVFEVC